MRDHGLKCRRKQSKPNLKDHHKLRRTHWCEAHLDWPWEFVVFTDESYFQLERNTIKLWSRHRLDARKRVHGPAVMVYGAISSVGLIALRVGTGGVNAQTYIDILQNTLVPS